MKEEINGSNVEKEENFQVKKIHKGNGRTRRAVREAFRGKIQQRQKNSDE